MVGHILDARVLDEKILQRRYCPDVSLLCCLFADRRLQSLQNVMSSIVLIAIRRPSSAGSAQLMQVSVIDHSGPCHHFA